MMDYQEAEDLMDNLSNQSREFDLESENQGWQASKHKKTKKKGRKQIVVATRTSSRIPRDGISITGKASQRAMARKCNR